MVRGWVGLGAALVMLCALAGCGAAGYEDAGRFTVRGATRGAFEGLEQLPKPLLKNLVDDAGVADAAREVARAGLVGVGEGVRQADLDGSALRFADALIADARGQGNALVGQILDEQGPRLRVLIAGTAGATVREATRSLEGTVEGDFPRLSRRVVDAAVAALVDALEGEAGQRLQRDAQRAGGDMSAALAGGAVRGARRELADPETAQMVRDLGEAIGGGVAKGVSEDVLQSGDTRGLWMGAAVACGVLLLVCAGVLAMYLRMHAALTRSLAVVAASIHELPEGDLRARVRGVLRGRARDARVKEVLAQHALLD
jgi:hypothetical protein